MQFCAEPQACLPFCLVTLNNMWRIDGSSICQYFLLGLIAHEKIEDHTLTICSYAKESLMIKRSQNGEASIQKPLIMRFGHLPCLVIPVLIRKLRPYFK